MLIPCRVSASTPPSNGVAIAKQCFDSGSRPLPGGAVVGVGREQLGALLREGTRSRRAGIPGDGHDAVTLLQQQGRQGAALLAGRAGDENVFCRLGIPFLLGLRRVR